MRVLLDEQLPIDLRHYFSREHQVVTVKYRGWSGLENGELLRKATQEFDAFITKDTQIPYQQNLSKFSMRFVLIKAPSNELEEILPALPAVHTALRELQNGSYRIVKV